MTQLGGHAQYLGFETLQESRAEPAKDTIRVLSEYHDGVCIRGGANFQSPIKEYAKWSTIPVIEAGGETHPCQALADLMTIREKKGRLEGIKVVIAWGPCFSYNKPPSLVFDTMFAGARLGMEIVVACPEGYDPYSEEVMGNVLKEADMGGASIEIMRDLKDALANADVIHSKNWIPWNCPVDEWKSPHLEAPEKYKHWTLDTNLLGYAKKDVIVMHAMPAHRGEELTDEVIEGPHSVVFDEAGNRMHAQKGLMALLMK
jgi:ornithine carbamoyltransferase